MRKQPSRLFLVLAVCAMVAVCFPAKSFCLLGPCAPWMTSDMGYRWQGQIGGPMHINEEYRWHYPVLTYGFDPSFLDAFGDDGVRAIEDAFQILNDLPPASEMVLSNYSMRPFEDNDYAQAMRLCDLKSSVLGCLVEQMGLTAPEYSMWSIRSRIVGDGGCPYDVQYLVLHKNYDPYSLQESMICNDQPISYEIVEFCENGGGRCYHIPEDPSYSGYSTVVSAASTAVLGCHCQNLSLDDAGGIHYLLNSTNINIEVLDNTVVPQEGSTNDIVRTAPRPGIEKITFIRHATNWTGGFAVMTNVFNDTFFVGGTIVTQEQNITCLMGSDLLKAISYPFYFNILFYANGIASTQAVQRVVSRPDILFAAEPSASSVIWNKGRPYLSFLGSIQKSGTERWTNCAALNGSYFGDGPGVIQGQVKITLPSFGRLTSIVGGCAALATRSDVSGWNWGRFLNGTNVHVFLGNQTNETSLTISAGIQHTNGVRQLRWDVFGRLNGHYRVDSSSLPDGGWVESCRMCAPI
jgi:hypothetical protein